MRVSIWQQFSSNHSARFTVVGKFKTTEDAASAAEAITNMTRAAVEWMQRRENAEVLEQREQGELVPATPPEREFAEKLGVSWGFARFGDMFTDRWQRAVTVFDTLVLIDGTESDYGAHPYDAIVARLGGEVYVDGTLRMETVEMQLSGDDEPRTYLDDPGDYSRLTASVSCRAADSDSAAQIQAEYEGYQERERATRGTNDWELFNTPWAEPGKQSSVSGELSRDGVNLNFSGLEFFHLVEGFPAMLSYLRAKGCTEIQYTFMEKRNRE
jgi:hypothetical protein